MDPLTIGTSTMGALHVFDQVANSLRTAGKAVDKYSTIVKGGSLVSVSAATRVEPFMLVDASLTNLEWLDTISHSMLANFSAFWMLAVDSITTVSNISVGEKLAPLNPNRQFGMESFKSADKRLMSAPEFMAKSQYKYGLPRLKLQGSMEAKGGSDPEEVKTGTNVKQALDQLNARTDLSVGKVFEVTVAENGQKASVKVAIRLLTSLVPTGLLKDILTANNHFDMDLKERWYATWAGRLSWNEFFFFGDILKKRKSIAMRDKSGVFQAILRRGNNNLVAGLVSRVPSLATMSNILVINASTLDEIEPLLGGSISHLKIRQQLFDATNLMIICVVHTDMDRCEIFYREISTSTTASLKDMKAASKEGGNSLNELFRTFVQGNAAVI